VVPLYIDKITAPTMSFQTMYYTNSAFNVPAKPLGGAIVAVGHPSVADLLGYPDNLTRYSIVYRDRAFIGVFIAHMITHFEYDAEPICEMELRYDVDVPVGPLDDLKILIQYARELDKRIEGLVYELCDGGISISHYNFINRVILGYDGNTMLLPSDPIKKMLLADPQWLVKAAKWLQAPMTVT